ncbi:hypothetical protein ACHAPV_005428 [Trichoderma viride]
MDEAPPVNTRGLATALEDPTLLMAQYVKTYRQTSDATTTKNSPEDTAEVKSMTGYSEQKHLLEEKLAMIPYAKLPPDLSVQTIDDSPSH